jgi:hypothetical protein
MLKFKCFQYRQERVTGLAAVGAEFSAEIRVHDQLTKRRYQVGTISGRGWQAKDSLLRVRLAVKKAPTESDPAEFKWIKLNYQFETFEEAKDWLATHLDLITRTVELYGLEID